ncbi:hypothetical protein NP233_g1898 [Leucocoprinus birnbaumii]|uniref:Uncharacterized protein n=1 Tax=Leucocoprinus birnbaumii TaxID=56174 RepID=A0AAD5YVD9_9AGAR|nr:hypothetical protein NP233_g1898 [Leucocoprinus birnbaumii]
MLLRRVTRALTASVEAALVLAKLGEAINTERRFSNRSLWSAIGEWQRITPVLYVFHRDGALLIIPIFSGNICSLGIPVTSNTRETVLSFLGMIAKIFPTSAVGRIDWVMWVEK